MHYDKKIRNRLNRRALESYQAFVSQASQMGKARVGKRRLVSGQCVSGEICPMIFHPASQFTAFIVGHDLWDRILEYLADAGKNAKLSLTILVVFYLL